jgi:sec-independent protein translocase protein TatC
MYLLVYILLIATVTFPFTGMIVERMSDDLVYNPSFSGIPGLYNNTALNQTGNFKLIQTQPLEYMMLQLKLSFIIGILAALPIVCFFGYRYLGMIKLGERFRVGKFKLLVVVVLAIALFLVGCAYSYLLMLPMVYSYLIQNAAQSGVVNNWRVSEFINFSMLTTLVFGLVFELPLVMTALARSGIVPVEIFKKYRRHMYIVILVVAALVTSPDVLTQIMVGVPLIIFYELSLFTMRFTVPQPRSALA